MAKLRSGNGNAALRHVRKSITFTGGAGAGAVGTVALFTLTGRVLLEGLAVYCTSTLTSGGAPTLSLGTASATTALVGTINPATDIGTDDWAHVGGGQAGACGAGTITSTLNAAGVAVPKGISESIIYTVGTASITGGTIILDLFYRPVTDNGLLVAA